MADALERALSSQAHQYIKHEIIVVTDAQVGLPHGWTERDRARTTTVLIRVNAERLSDQERLAKRLAQRVLAAQPMQRPDQLPYLVALAAWRRWGKVSSTTRMQHAYFDLKWACCAIGAAIDKLVHVL